MKKKLISKFLCSTALGLSFVGGAQAASLSESDYEKKAYRVQADEQAPSCRNNAYQIIESLPKGFHSVVVGNSFRGNQLEIEVVKKKSVSENFSFNVVCVMELNDGTNRFVPVGKISLP